MDPYDPVAVVGRCLIEAEQTLEEIADGGRSIDLEGEFLVNWSADCLFPIVLWNESDADKRLLSVVNVDFPHKAGLCLITDKTNKTVSCFQKSGFSFGSVFEDCALEFKSQKFPAIDPDKWPITNLRDALAWIKYWDPDLCKSFFGRLESNWTKAATRLFPLFDTPAGRFGFEISINYINDNERKRLAKKRGDRRQRIIQLNPAIKRFTVSDLSPSFIHGRNQVSRETLFGKRISVVGCGTVGGYLISFLARLGAGVSDGVLKIYDNQILLPENVGRHVLSVRDLLRNKAKGVADQILSEFPYADIRAREIDATRAKDLFDAELIIDATGSHAISSHLNREHLRLLKTSQTPPALIYTWVEGPGDAARCLLVDSRDYMCFDCMTLRRPNQAPRPRFPVSTREVSDGREFPGGCGSYMPFAVSAPSSAASLTLDLVSDWVRGKPGPRLRSRSLDANNTQSRKDNSPKPLSSCPACQGI